jgi:hypothetical protein
MQINDKSTITKTQCLMNMTPNRQHGIDYKLSPRKNKTITQ